MATRSENAVFLDRDGVINELVWDDRSGSHESPYEPEDVQLIPGAVEGIEALFVAGYKLIVVSNQPAAAKGRVSLEELEQISKKVVSLLAESDLTLDGYYYCHHHPEGVVAELSRECACRKPSIGLLKKAALDLDLELEQSWIVGDSDTDAQAGVGAGCQAALVENPLSSHRRNSTTHADLRAPDLRAAALAIIDQGRR